LTDQILYKNNQLIGVNKQPGIPVQQDLTGDDFLAQSVEKYCHHPVHIIHRIDRPTSGIVVFAKNKKALANMNAQMSDRKTKKTYLAIVGKRPEKDSGTLTHYLLKDAKKNKCYVVNKDRKGCKEAILEYKLIDKSEHLFLLEINLITGRHHQIRAQLAAMGSTIRGDVKYGFKRANKNKSINLHAWKFEFRHPVTGAKENIIAEVPDYPEWKAFNTLEKK